jgi:ribosomal protein S17E
MGRIKQKLIKRTSRKLIQTTPETFTKDFDHNKQAMGSSLPSKKNRNKIAGYLARIKKNTKTLIDDEENGTE